MVEQKQFSIFVNNIPDVVDPKWLFEIFEKCGKVSEVFIPNNKNKVRGDMALSDIRRRNQLRKQLKRIIGCGLCILDWGSTWLDSRG